VQKTSGQILVHGKINYACRILFMLILNYFKYAYFKLFRIFNIKTKNVAPDVGHEHATLTLSLMLYRLS